MIESDELFEYLGTISERFAIITDKNVEKLYGQKLLENLSYRGCKVSLFSIAGGDICKTRATKEWLEDELLRNGYGRDSCILALGGGVVGDIAGFVAATYCRGIPYVMLPTTLLAMVDASIGGKTGVNVPQGKNMVGAIYQPKAIFADIQTLETLPLSELQCGIVECIKHGLIQDASHVAFLEQNVQKILRKDPQTLAKLVADSSKIKRAVVEEDAHETGLRRILNFGHTIGHAIEAVTEYKVPHGTAVAIGMKLESYMSYQLGILSDAAYTRICQLLNAYMPNAHIDLPLEMVLQALKIDKKARKGMPRFVILEDIGKCLPCNTEYCQEVPNDILIKTLQHITREK